MDDSLAAMGLERLSSMMGGRPEFRVAWNLIAGS
jgi:hypothetical protein